MKPAPIVPSTHENSLWTCRKCGALFDPDDSAEAARHLRTEHATPAELPPGGWIRQCGDLPNEPRPELSDLSPLRDLREGARVFLECVHNGMRTAGWGRLIKAPIGWAVSLPGGTYVGMDVPHLKRCCFAAPESETSGQSTPPRTRQSAASERRTG